MVPPAPRGDRARVRQRPRLRGDGRRPRSLRGPGSPDHWGRGSPIRAAATSGPLKAGLAQPGRPRHPLSDKPGIGTLLQGA